MRLHGKKYIWHLPNYNAEPLHTFARTYNLSLPIVQTALSRGHTSPESFENFIFCSKENNVSHAGILKDSEKAVQRIITAIKNKEKILIAGDYDVDGITSSALMLECLLPLGAAVNFFLPHRVRDGYGLSVKTIQRAAQSGYTLIITVDNGITAFEPAQEAKKLGLDIIITDHHRPHDHLPDVYAVIDPHQTDCKYPYKYFAGVGISFKIMSLLYEKLNLTLPPKVYELLLLGTVADVVPLTGENRFWVRQGLKFLSASESIPLNVLKQNARYTKPLLRATDIGFCITPQINALGRLDDSRQAVKFLLGSDLQETERIGKVLGELNEARKTIERSVFLMVETEILENRIDVTKENIILAAHDQWPPGVIGLVASRVVSSYGRPTMLFHLTAEGKAKGSCRSIPAFNFFEALQHCQDLLDTFGGHAMAAGLSLDSHKLPLLKERLEAYIAQKLTADDFKPKIYLDAELSLSEINKKLISDMDYLEPFGCENTQPIFHVKQVMLREQPTLLKNAHVKCSIFAEGIIKPVIFFNRPELYTLLQDNTDKPFDLAAQVIENHWNGRTTLELCGIDIALSNNENLI